MASGRKIKLPKGTKIQGDLIVINQRPRDRSHAIAMSKSKKQRPVPAGRMAIENAKRGK